MKSVLIISPHFPPVNAADMHRVRQSLPYFKKFGWKPVVVAVSAQYVETGQDELLEETIPNDIEVHYIKALPTHWTRKAGLGSLALRSMWFYYKAVNQLLKNRKFDLIYFSTTTFPLPVLGSYWKKTYNIPYIIDMQDPWHSDYYLSKPKEERPPKHWFSYRLNKYTEPVAMKLATGIISVSEAYCTTLQSRYPNVTPERCTTITFGAFPKDFDILNKHSLSNRFFDKDDRNIHIPYIGRAGHDMQFSLTCIFQALKKGLQEKPELFERVRLYFIGTSYASAGKGKPTVYPVAQATGVEKYVEEYTDRIPYFEALQLLKDASMLLVPGSDDPQYTASKLYNYILARKPLLAIFHQDSSVVKILHSTRAGNIVPFTDTNKDLILETASRIYQIWQQMLGKIPFTPDTDWQAFQPFTTEEMTKRQVAHFEKILNIC